MLDALGIHVGAISAGDPVASADFNIFDVRVCGEIVKLNGGRMRGQTDDVVSAGLEGERAVYFHASARWLFDGVVFKKKGNNESEL